MPATAEEITSFQSRLLTPKRSNNINPASNKMPTIIIWPDSKPILKAKSWDVIC